MFRLHMLPGVIVKELAIAVNATDNSFMPKDLTVSAGYSEAGLRELKTVTVPKWVMCTSCRLCGIIKLISEAGLWELKTVTMPKWYHQISYMYIH